MILFAIASICSLMIYAQQTLPSVDLKTLDGKAINTKEISNDGKPFAICFWATWCKPCLMELSTFAILHKVRQTYLTPLNKVYTKLPKNILQMVFHHC